MMDSRNGFFRFTGRYPAMVAGLGAMLCITTLAGLDGLNNTGLWLMAPFGATMVILFGLPESPLAQPRNIFFGHLLTTLVGLMVLNSMGVQPWSLGLAVGLAVSLMMLTKTTHPPAGANPLIVMLGGQDWNFLWSPVALGAGIIIMGGWAYHRSTGRNYPARW
ncbi:HPP family protein [Oceanimonas baumannii]|uniref:HPP family protein n=2 Tax=Oceanimonas baumannii TaxID=129578 RepID=A0ABY2EV59_9GAMM|nr:HPP family protein [Oceanimonas baumannii]TDW55866.1 HPP family protein [Oceanimonas baumannii]